MKKHLPILIFLLALLIVLFAFGKQFAKTDTQQKQLILVGIDGVNVEEYKRLLSENKLPHFKKLIGTNGTSTEALITGHDITETAPGNAELHTGLPAEITSIYNNACGGVIPQGLTTFERLANFDARIVVGSIYGKETCYLPNELLKHAKLVISWWHDSHTYPQQRYVDDKCSDSTDIARKSLEFINMNKGKDFYLFVYLSVPDCAGHEYGVPSSQYEDALINVDKGLGILLENLEQNSINPQILISGDHGWNLNSKSHSKPNLDTQRVILISNNSDLVDGKGNGQQCDIAPTILDYFGMKESDYPDIREAGCGSLK